jgi:lysophospholipase L1-like esterase
MPVGDSITHGYQGGSVNADGNGYRLQLWNDLTNDSNNITKYHIAGSQVSGDLPDPYNEGYNGALISEIATNINGSLSSMRPNVVLIHAGTNDMNRPVDPDTAPDRLGDLIDEVVAACPDAAVLVAEIIVIADSDSNSRRETYNAAIPDVVSARANAGKQVMLVDMSNLLTTDDLIDGLHPLDQGYNKMGDAWFSAIQTASQNGWIKTPVPLSGSSSGNSCSSPPTWYPRNQIASGTGSSDVVFADIDGKNMPSIFPHSTQSN